MVILKNVRGHVVFAQSTHTHVVVFVTGPHACLPGEVSAIYLATRHRSHRSEGEKYTPTGCGVCLSTRVHLQKNRFTKEESGKWEWLNPVGKEMVEHHGTE
mmetsp:Transcript_12728/g.13675  ORF Transcript_12728/g.13675 Transcript_12728/m.13675 type:complete len:101 (+) Transcript_12728:140-442(+)